MPQQGIFPIPRFISRKVAVLVGLVVATGIGAPGASGQGGTLDPTFSGNGKVSFSFAPRGAAGIRDIAVQSDGKLVAVGRRGRNFAVLRFMPDGSLDTTFGGDGKVTTWFPNAFGFAEAVAIQADGKILAAGTMSGRHDGGRFAFARYLPNGHLDPTFGGGDGKVRQQFSRHFDACNAVAIQTNGKIVAAGESSRHTFGSSFAVMRLNVTGKLDKSFNADGRRLIDFSDENLLDRAIGVVLQPDGKIVLGGSAGDPLFFGAFFALARLNVDGSLDPSFGSGGKVVSIFPPLIQLHRPWHSHSEATESLSWPDGRALRSVRYSPASIRTACSTRLLAATES